MRYEHNKYKEDGDMWRGWGDIQKRDKNDVCQEFVPILNARLFSSFYINAAASGKTEAVFKLSSQAMGKKALRQVMEYLSRDAEYMEKEKPLFLEDEQALVIKGKEERETLIQEWGKTFEAKESYKKQEWKTKLLREVDYERFKLGYKAEKESLSREEKARLEKLKKVVITQKYIKNGKEIDLRISAKGDTRHIILSIGEQHSPRRANKAVREYLQESFGVQGYKYVFVLHNDTNNQHAHVILKNRNEMTGKSLSFDKEDLFIQRQLLAEKLTKYGIERVSTLKRDRTHSLENLEKKAFRLFERKTWFQEKVEQSKAVDAVGFRSNSLKTTSFLIKEVQEQQKGIVINMPLYKKLGELKSQLKEHKKALMNIPPEQQEKEHQLTVKQLVKNHKQILGKSEKLNLSPSISPYKRKAVRRKQIAHKEFAEKHQKQVAEAIKELKKNNSRLSGDNLNRNKQAVKRLKELQKQQKRGVKL